jgi:2,3-bisphosphoglycerate-independent phosphoglycerate mutase
VNAFTLESILQDSASKILLFVLDGLGGLPKTPDGKTELETAATPNLDGLARAGICGLHEPIHPAVTPGSGPSHLALFGYDPVKYHVGRGVLSALGIDHELDKNDVAARGNFCTLDGQGLIADRRAGRISTQTNQQLCDLLNQIELNDGRIEVRTVSEHRFLLVLKGSELSDDVADTDPQNVGRRPQPALALSETSEKTARLINEFVDQAQERLKDQKAADGVLLRGFSKRPSWPSMTERYGLNPVAIASYPMYRGVAKLVGMTAPRSDDSLSDEIGMLMSSWKEKDFFYLHFKKTDSAGEDGNFDKKVSFIEAADDMVPRFMDMEPDVVIVTGDHSTPAILKSHSWHPVPVLLWSRFCRPDNVRGFGERSCMTGGLGPRMRAADLVPLALANAGRLRKFGA